MLRSWDSGWEAFDITPAGLAWAKEPSKNFGIELSVHTLAGVELNASSIGFVGFHGPQEKRPFLVSFYQQDGEQDVTYRRFYPQNSFLPRSRRSPRSLGSQFTNVGGTGNHRNGNTKSCSRRMLYVSFERLGWQDWIIAPEGYVTYHTTLHWITYRVTHYSELLCNASHNTHIMGILCTIQYIGGLFNASHNTPEGYATRHMHTTCQRTIPLVT